MSTEGIPTPRTDKRDGAAGVSGEFCRHLERELFLANQNLQAIRELAQSNREFVWVNDLQEILNS